MKRVCILLCCATCVAILSCNNKHKKSWEELEYERQENYERQKAMEDSVKKVKHDEIEETLSKTDDGHIMGEFFFGMTEKDFGLALKKYNYEICRVDIDGITFDVQKHSNNLVFEDDKLVKLGLVTTYSRTIKLPSSRGSISDVSIDDPGPMIKNKVYRHLCAKYGEADCFYNHNEPSNSNEFDYARWEYSFKIIEIKDELASVERGYNGITEDYHFLYIIFSDPVSFKRNEFVADSIRKERLKLQQELKVKEKALSEEL